MRYGQVWGGCGNAIRRIILIAYLALLSYMLLTPSPPGVGGNDKIGHLGAFFVLGALVWWNASGPWREVVAFIVAVSVGGATEVAQAYIPGRTLEAADVAANMVGSGWGAFGMGFASGPMRRVKGRIGARVGRGGTD